MMLTTSLRGLSQKSLAILLALGLLGGAATGAAWAPGRPCVHAMMAPTTPPAASSLVDINSASKADLSALPGYRRRLFPEDHRRQAVQDQDRPGEHARLFLPRPTPRIQGQNHRHPTQEVGGLSQRRKGARRTALLFLRNAALERFRNYSGIINDREEWFSLGENHSNRESR